MQLADKGDWLFLSWLVDHHQDHSDFNFLAGIDRSNFFQVLIKQRYDLKRKYGETYQADKNELILSVLNRLAEKMSPVMISKIDEGGQSALWDAIKYNDLLFVTFLLEKNANLTILGVKDANNIYHHTIIHASKEILKAVLFHDKHKDLLHKPNAQGYLPITLAVGIGSPDHVKILIENGAQFVPFENNESYIHVALNNPNPKNMITYLCDQQNFSISKMDELDNNILHVLINKNSDIKLIKEILPLCTPDIINADNKNKQTPLHLAAAQGRLDILIILLASGAKITQDQNGNTPMHLAAIKKQERCNIFFTKSPNTKDLLLLRNENGETVDDIIKFGAKITKPDVPNSHEPVEENKPQEEVKHEETKLEENKVEEVNADELSIVETKPIEAPIEEASHQAKEEENKQIKKPLNPNVSSFTPRLSSVGSGNNFWQQEKSFMRDKIISPGMIIFQNKREYPDFSQNLHPSLYIFYDLYYKMKEINTNKNWIDIFLGHDAALDALFNIRCFYPVLFVYIIGLNMNQLKDLFIKNNIQIVSDKPHLQISYENQLINIYCLASKRELVKIKNQFSIQDVYIDLLRFKSICANEETFNRLNERVISYNNDDFNPKYLPDLFPAVELHNKLKYFQFVPDKNIKYALDIWNNRQDFISLSWQEMGLYTQFLDKELNVVRQFVMDIEKGKKSTSPIMDVVGTTAAELFLGQGGVKNDVDLALFGIHHDEFVEKLKKEGIEFKIKPKRSDVQVANEVGPSQLNSCLPKPKSISFKIGKVKFDVTCVADLQQREENLIKRDAAITATAVQYYPEQKVFGLPSWILSIKSGEIICTRDPYIVFREEFKRKIRLLNLLKFANVTLSLKVQAALYESMENNDSDPFAIAMLITKLLKNFGVTPAIILLKQYNLLDQIVIKDPHVFDNLLGDKNINITDQPLMEKFYQELATEGPQIASTHLLPQLLDQYRARRNRKDLILIAKCLMGNASVDGIIEEYQMSINQNHKRNAPRS